MEQEHQDPKELKRESVCLLAGRVCLRPVQPCDADDLAAQINDKEIAANTRTIEYPYPKERAPKWIEMQKKNWREGKAFVFSILDAESDQFMGVTGLNIDNENHNAELGYWLGRDYWNQGYCTEAVKLLIDFGFEKLGLHKIYAHHVSRNPASGRVLEKAGMLREGYLREQTRKWGVFEDIVVYGMLDRDERP